MNLEDRAVSSLELDGGTLNSGVWRTSPPLNNDRSVSVCSPDVCRYRRPSDMYNDTEYRSSYSTASFEHLYRTEMFGRVRTNLDNRALGNLGLDSSTLNSGVWRRPGVVANGNSSLRSILNETYNSHAYYGIPQYSSFYSPSELSSSPESYITYDTTNKRLPRKITKRSESSESSNELSALSINNTKAIRISDRNPSTYNIWEDSNISPTESDFNEISLRINEMLNSDSNTQNSADHLFEYSNSDQEDHSSTFCQLLQNHYFPESNQFGASSGEFISSISKIHQVWDDRAGPSPQMSNHSKYAQEQFMRNENFAFSDQSINDIFNTPDIHYSTPQKSFYSPTFCNENMFQIGEPSYTPTTTPQRTFEQLKYPSAKISHIWKDCTVPSAQISNHSSYAEEQFMGNENFSSRDQSVNDLFKTPDTHRSTQKSLYSPTSCHENTFQIAEPSYAPTIMPQRSLTFQQFQTPSRQPCNEVQDKSAPLLENRKGLKRMMKANSSDWCNFCMKNGESIQVYSKHSLKERRGKKMVVTCPILRSFVCSTCKATGDNAHTETYCPVLMSRNNGQRIPSTTITVKSTRTKSNGQRRY